MTSKFYFEFVLLLGALWTCVKLMEIFFSLFEFKRNFDPLQSQITPLLNCLLEFCAHKKKAPQ